MKLTKKAALAMFREVYTGPRGDTVMKRETWNNFTDCLRSERQITPHQYETWTNPF